MKVLIRSLFSVFRPVASVQSLIAVCLIYALLASQNVALGAVPPEPTSGSGAALIPGLTPQKLLEEALSYFLEKKMGNVLPVNLEASSALQTVPNGQLPGGPFHGKPLALTQSAVSQPLAPGDYEVPVMAYCTQFSVHRPGRNAATVIAPLTGTQAKAIGDLLWRGTQAGKNPQELQNAAWAIQNGATFDKLTKQEQADVMAYAPEARSSLEGGFSFDKPLRDLYNTISANPRPYILQYKHEKGIKFPPDIAIPNIKITLPPFDAFIAHVGGPLGRAYERAVQDQQAYLKYLEAKQHKQEQPYVASTDPPLPPTQGPWTARVPGRVYMRAIVQGGNMQADNILQIRVLPGTPVAEHASGRPHLVLAAYYQSSSGSTGPSVLALMGAPANALSPAYTSPTPVRYPNPVRDPTGPIRDPIPVKPVEPPPVFPGEPVPPGEIAPIIEEGGEAVIGVVEGLDPYFYLILFSVIAAQALIIALPRIERDIQTLTENKTSTKDKSDDDCPGNRNHPALYRGGNATSPKLDNVRPKDFPGLSSLERVSPPGGISTFSTPTDMSPPVWIFPAHGSIPKGLCVVNDRGNHWTWEPSVAMPIDIYKGLLISTYPYWSKLGSGIQR